MDRQPNVDSMNWNPDEENAKKGGKTAVKVIIIIAIVLVLLAAVACGIFYYKLIKLSQTPREALSISEFTNTVEELGYEASDSVGEEYEGGSIYVGNEGRTVLIFWEFASKRDARNYFEELLDVYNMESASVNVHIDGVNFMIRTGSKIGIYYYAEIVEGTVVFITTEDKDEMDTIKDALDL